MPMKALLPGKHSGLFIFIALCLACRQYFGNADAIISLADQTGIDTLPLPFLKFLTAITTGEHACFYRLLIWVGGCVMFYLLLPMFFIRLYIKEPVKSFGFSGNITLKDTRPYAYLLLIMLPLIALASYTPGFRNTYPFYHPQPFHTTYFIAWEAAYLLQFLAVEFFFRGFMLFSFHKLAGEWAVAMMMIPYCMIHFGKPFPETIGSIFAAFILGKLALKSRSIWPGVALHYAVALTMDLLSLWQHS